jgi:hypothetical protein
MQMAIKEDKYYFLNWELIPSSDDLIDATQGNELVEITIQDIDRCRPAIHYTVPIVQPGQSFALIRTNLLYPKDACSKPLRNILLTTRIVRGHERRVIYANDYILAAPFYANGDIFRMPIFRVWYWEDYVRLILTKLFP